MIWYVRNAKQKKRQIILYNKSLVQLKKEQVMGKSLLLMQIMENTYGFMTGVFLPYRFGGQAPQLLQTS